MNGKPPKFTSTWKTIPNPQFDAKGIYRKELAPPERVGPLGIPCTTLVHPLSIPYTCLVLIRLLRWRDGAAAWPQGPACPGYPRWFGLDTERASHPLAARSG